MKLAKILKYALAIIILTSFQVSLCPYISIFSVMPNIVIAFAISVAINEGPVSGGIVGLISGIFIDVLSSGTSIINSITYMYLPVIFGFLNINFFRKNLGVTVLFTFLSSIICESLIHFLHYSIIGISPFFYSLFVKIIPISIYTALISIPVHYLTVKIFGQTNRRDYIN